MNPSEFNRAPVVCRKVASEKGMPHLNLHCFTCVLTKRIEFLNEGSAGKYTLGIDSNGLE